jgi:hypothetical protein
VGISRIERETHNWRKLAKISKEKAGASSKHFLGMVRKGLTKMSVNLT